MESGVSAAHLHTPFESSEVSADRRDISMADQKVPFKVAFNGKASFPIIQVSLPGDGSPVSAAKLGKALAPLRSAFQPAFFRNIADEQRAGLWNNGHGTSSPQPP